MSSVPYIFMNFHTESENPLYKRDWSLQIDYAVRLHLFAGLRRRSHTLTGSWSSANSRFIFWVIKLLSNMDLLCRTIKSLFNGILNIHRQDHLTLNAFERNPSVWGNGSAVWGNIALIGTF